MCWFFGRALFVLHLIGSVGSPLWLVSNHLFAEEPAVSFDVPALLSAREIPFDSVHFATTTQKTIEVIVPVTSEIVSADQGNIIAFRFDVFWNRHPFPICDYGPKSQTVSDIAGTISVDRSIEKNSTLGLKLSGGFQNTATGTGHAELTNREGTKVQYHEIPQHEVLVAAGTIRRGTGAFFRFHPSRVETLEGGRDLILAFQVPQSWRGGLIQVECTATGSRKVLAWQEPFEVSQVFIVPIFLDSDDSARLSATQFVRREQQLRQSWQRYQTESESAQPQSPFSAVIFSASSRKKNTSRSLPENWVHTLIQTNNTPLEKYHGQLPADLATAATEFVHARAELLELSR